MTDPRRGADPQGRIAMLLAGIDIGSTSIKACIFEHDGRLVAAASRPTERAHPDPARPERTVWPPDRIWGGAAEALREAIGAIADPRAIRAVAVTGMGMDGVPIDRAGRWLYPFISWLDPRTEPQRRWWIERIGEERQFAITGNQVWPILAALRILWMKENEPAILGRTWKWLLIEDFVNYMLCGVAATDRSMASNTLLFDQRRRTYCDELLALAGIDRDLLCDPLPSGTAIGGVTRAAGESTGLPEGTPVVLGGHDYLCAALAAGAWRPGAILDVTGTWEIVVAALEAPVLTESVRRMGIVVESHVARDAYAAMTASVAADMLEWFRRECGDPRQGWGSIIEAARASPPLSRGAIFLPHMAGSTAPVADPRAMGAFVGLRSFAARGDLIRAIFEGLDYQFREILEALESGLGIRIERIAAVGGAVQNDFWLQNKSDVTGREIEVPAIEEATALGAAMLAGIGAGVYRDEADAWERVRRSGRLYEPDPALRSLYDGAFARYRQLYPALKGVHGAIYEATA